MVLVQLCGGIELMTADVGQDFRGVPGISCSLSGTPREGKKVSRLVVLPLASRNSDRQGG